MDARDKRGHDEQLVGPGEGRTMMRKALVAFANFAAAVLAVTSAQAQQTVKIGLILAYSGQFADPSAQMDNGIKLYLRRHGDTAAGKKLELIRRDTGGIAPEVVKPLPQPLRRGANLDERAGRALTPNSLAVGELSAP